MSAHIRLERSPSTEIHVTLNGQPVPDAEFYAWLLICQDKFSSDSMVLKSFNFSIYDKENNCYWDFIPFLYYSDCQNGTCHFTRFAPHRFRLVVFLPSQNKRYLSNDVMNENFRSTFEANLLPNGSIVLRDATPLIQIPSAEEVRVFLIALIITLIVELIVAMIYISIKKIPKRVLISVLAANILSLPLIWFVFPLLKNTLLIILFGELFAFAFEGYFIHVLNKEILPLKKSFVLSALMNLASLIIGGFIFFMIVSYLTYSA